MVIAQQRRVFVSAVPSLVPSILNKVAFDLA